MRIIGLYGYSNCGMSETLYACSKEPAEGMMKKIL